MSSNVRPESMARITNFELANAFIDEQIKEIRAQVGDKKVLLALSGGVDSSVVAALLIKAIGKQLVCVHVNHGLMRKDESESVIKMFKEGLDANLIYVDATDHFLGLLAGVSDPERKRKIIGAEFITVFANEARKLEGISYLAQGTIYPDILESIKAAEGKRLSSLTTTSVVCLRICSSNWLSLSSCCSRTKSVLSAKLWVCPMLWFIASPSPVPVWVSAAWVPLPATVWKHCAKLMRFCVRNLTSAA